MFIYEQAEDPHLLHWLLVARTRSPPKHTTNPISDSLPYRPLNQVLKQ